MASRSAIGFNYTHPENSDKVESCATPEVPFGVGVPRQFSRSFPLNISPIHRGIRINFSIKFPFIVMAVVALVLFLTTHSLKEKLSSVSFHLE